MRQVLPLILAAALCAAPAAMAAAPKAAPSKTAPAKPAPPAAAPTPVPSLIGSWRLMTRDREQQALVEAGSARRQGDKAQILMALNLRAPITASGINASLLLNVYEMDCEAGSARVARTVALDEAGGVQYDTGPRTGAAVVPEADSNLARLVAMACGTLPLPQQPQWPDPLIARKGWIAASGG
jgi:hypothetical protein